jgi:hypothetical protein
MDWVPESCAAVPFDRRLLSVTRSENHFNDVFAMNKAF